MELKKSNMVFKILKPLGPPIVKVNISTQIISDTSEERRSVSFNATVDQSLFNE